MEAGEIFFYTLGLIIVFFLLVIITRWVYKINEFLRYQKAMTFLLLKIAKKDMEESEIKTVISLLNKEIKVDDFKITKSK